VSRLPAGWAELSLIEACTKITDGTHHSPPNTVAGEFKYVTAKNIKRHGLDLTDLTYVPAEVHRGIYERCPVEQGDVLYIKDGATTGLAINNPLAEPFSLLSSVALLKPNRRLLDERYLRHWLNSPETLASMIGQMSGSAIKRLTLTTISGQRLPLPPLVEQRRIVPKLDAMTARTARARADLDRIPGLVARYKQAVLAKAFAGELFADGGVSWKPLTLGELGKWGSGGTPKSGRAEYYGGAIPWVRSGDLCDGPVASHLVTITDAGLANSSAKWVPTGSVLLAMYGATIGKVGLTTYPVTTNQAVASLQCEQSLVSPSFAFWLLRSLKPAFVGAGQGGAQPNISQTIIKAWPVLVPALDEQEKVVRALERAFTEIDRLTAEAAAARRLLDRLDQAVLAKAFRGELVPQDPADEPASVLLDRIRAERAAAPKAKRGRRVAA
jgi:type I restriction enzyme S subunit